MSEETITITKEECDELMKDCHFMRCLENVGVDNWDGYELYSEMEKEWEDE